MRSLAAHSQNQTNAAKKVPLKITRLESEFSSVGGAPATGVEAVVLAAGDPGSNPAPSGPILRVIAPLSAPCFLSISTNLYNKGKKIYLKK